MTTPLSDSPFLRACRGETPDHVPVWFMRQAGRSLPEYRKLREGVAMLDSCFTTELVVEITMQPVRRHGVDAAIFFSDIVVPLKAIGVDLDIVAGTEFGGALRPHVDHPPGPDHPQSGEGLVVVRCVEHDLAATVTQGRPPVGYPANLVRFGCLQTTDAERAVLRGQVGAALT